MYGYYTLKALRVNIPRPIAFVITTSQILQMIFGFFINTHTLLLALFTPNTCQCSLRASVSGFLLYALFFYYFVRFFVDAYLYKQKGKLNSKLHSHADTKHINVKCQNNATLNYNNHVMAKANLVSDLNNNHMHLSLRKHN